MQEVFIFHPIYKETIWGGNHLKELFQRDLPSLKIGESWEISAYGKDISIVKNGKLEGYSLQELFDNYKLEIFGEPLLSQKEFPLLVKIIDANDKLSVQVHPNDEYTKLYDPTNKGKKEAWIILHSKENSKIYCGFKETLTKEKYLEEIRNKRAENYLLAHDVKRGDAFLIEPGTIHAIGAGNVILEIQQSADSTYRVYDYGRVDKNGNPRPLHLDKALSVLNFQKSNQKEKLSYEELSPNERYLLTSNDKFRLEKWFWSGKKNFYGITKPASFHIFHILEGELQILDYQFKKGDTLLLSAYGLQKGLELEGSAELAIMCVGSDLVQFI
ncbi:MAG: class I mannose-6-phosphate isomerase [Leptospiraceae bacterium]|nr:class I mannose-6-phosphate isomerase [Leptospiraceae bacterium]